MTQEMIGAKGVSKVYVGRHNDKRIALADVDLSVAEGEFLTVVGPSGCGKTTLMKLFGGLVAPSSGTLSFRGIPGPVPPGMYGLVFQAPSLLPWRRVIDNVTFPATILGLDRRAARRRGHELLESVGLGDVASNYPGELSGGMQQRAGIARALLHDPLVLLMDEPFAAVDALTREVLAWQLQDIHLAQQKTVVFVTHSIQEAVLLGDRVLVMTPSPGRAVALLPITLPRPRTIDNLTGHEFVSIEAQVRDALNLGSDRRGAMGTEGRTSDRPFVG